MNLPGNLCVFSLSSSLSHCFLLNHEQLSNRFWRDFTSTNFQDFGHFWLLYCHFLNILSYFINWVQCSMKLSWNWAETEQKLSRNWAETEQTLYLIYFSWFFFQFLNRFVTNLQKSLLMSLNPVFLCIDQISFQGAFRFKVQALICTEIISGFVEKQVRNFLVIIWCVLLHWRE